MSTIESLFTPKEAAQLLGISEQTIRKHARFLQIPKFGSDSKRGVYLLSQEDVDRISVRLADYRVVRVPRSK